MTLLAFVVALSVIVAIHEYGHYIVGRWSGIKADVFSIGFGPVIWARTDRHGTQWQIAALPFGGYVKFHGDAGAASDKASEDYEAMSPEERRTTMHGAPLWARSATVVAGPLFNFVLSILVFGGIMMVQGKVAEPLTVGEVKPLPVAADGLQAGDRLLEIAGRPVPDFAEEDAFDDFVAALPEKRVIDYTVERDGKTRVVQGPHPMPPLASQLAPQSAAYDAGMKPGDVITAVDGDPVAAFSQLKEIVESSGGRPLDLTVWRDGRTLDLTLEPRRMDEPLPDGGFQTQWRIGIAGGFAFEPATERLGPLAAVGAGAAQTWGVVTNSLSGFYHMVTGAISSCNMSGPIGIAEVSGAMASQGVESFVWFIAVLSTAVGLLNLFPIPVLDGGHLLFHVYEAATGRPPSDAALRVLMTLGLAVILSLMVFALGNDLFCN
ncbi:RIP metalloprotease RseP [Roseovarius salinarum]|uniref:RIP metalloprotease RseP n=1 Tax=Roseovarius salinarum TaxID=1981892 RepID=UPI000C32B8DC